MRTQIKKQAILLDIVINYSEIDKYINNLSNG